jgi:hypothetical protein
MKNWSLNAKVVLVVGILTVAAVTISFVGLNKMNTINHKGFANTARDRLKRFYS